MKKILFATTALIATAGMAAAEVRISGYGRFGLDYNDANDRAVNGISSTNITSRLRLQFDMSTETDGGVKIGARTRAQSESRDNAPGGAAFNGARFFASYGGFTLQVGNIAGAIDSMPGIYLPTSSAGTGIDGMGFNALPVPGGFIFDAYSSAGVGANGFEVIYSGGNFAGHVSYSTTNGATGIDRIAAYASYSFGNWQAALGMQTSDLVATAAVAGQDFAVLTVTGDLGQFGLGLAYGSTSDAGGLGFDIDKLRVYGTFDIGSASTVLVWVSSTDVPAGSTVAGVLAQDGTSYGLNYTYDLGGGVSFDAGYVETAANQTQVQAGVYFRF